MDVHVFQRPKERKVYNDEGMDDDEIYGKRTFNLEDKIHSTNYNKQLVKEVKGTGGYTV